MENTDISSALVPELIANERQLDISSASSRQPWMCAAHLRDGSGNLCRKPRMVGQIVCASHGGSAPQNLAAARKRLVEFTDPIMAALIETAMAPSGFCPRCGRQADALRLRAQIACIDRAMQAVPEGDSAASAMPPYLRWMSNEDFDTLTSIIGDARRRMDAGEPEIAPGGQVREHLSLPSTLRPFVHLPSNGRTAIDSESQTSAQPIDGVLLPEEGDDA